MRDPERIHRICQELEEMWLKEPDWRFGQLLYNSQIFDKFHDPFYQEDDVTEAKIGAYDEYLRHLDD